MGNTFDLQLLLKLLDEDTVLIKEIIASFVENVSKDITALELAIDKGCPEDICRCVHKIKGVSANFGAENLQQAANKIGTMAKMDDFNSVRHCFNELKVKQIELEETIANLKW